MPPDQLDENRKMLAARLKMILNNPKVKEAVETVNQYSQKYKLKPQLPAKMEQLHQAFQEAFPTDVSSTSTPSVPFSTYSTPTG